MYILDKFCLFLSWRQGRGVRLAGRRVFFGIIGKCVDDRRLGTGQAAAGASVCRGGRAQRRSLFVLAGIAGIRRGDDQPWAVLDRDVVFLHRQYGVGGLSKARHPGVRVNKLGHGLWCLLSGLVFVCEWP